MCVVVVGCPDADHSGFATGDKIDLVRMEPRWGTVAGCVDVVWYGVGILGISYIACCHSRRYAGFIDGFKHLTVNAHSPNARLTCRDVDDVGTMVHGKVDA